ncbi:MAG TPA: tripartite tricarboxylate transporter substrate-binding protein, partial [Burkholderiales bacterium]|nr:tripartite tricarboxylate transporter substrate-binding protein [Burkholderiales bacterium]
SILLPEVPTAAESGYPQATMNFWMGIEGPAGIPAPVVDKIAAGLKQVVASQEAREQFKTVGAEAFYTTPAEFKTLRDADIVKYGKLVQQLGLKQ